MDIAQGTNPFNLGRFVEAQNPVIADVVAELQRGRKTSHWMWFVFPQIVGLASSPIARRFAIGSLAEAEAYLAHPILGERLRRCTRVVLAIKGASLREVFGSPDDLKFHSSMTLFARASPTPDLFQEALTVWFKGLADPATLDRLRGAGR